MIKTCLFDLGNVLVRFDHGIAVDAIAALTGRDAAAVRAFLFDEGRQWDYERGTLSTDGFHAALAQWSGRTFAREALLTAACDIFTADAAMLDLVRGLKDAGYRLVLLSNTNDAHFAWIWRRFPVVRLFDAFTLSYQVGAMKPEAAIYDDALAKAQAEPGACFYTDDVPAYVDAARERGIQAFVHTGAARTRETLAALGVTPR